jgi:hypothetical protein
MSKITATSDLRLMPSTIESLKRLLADGVPVALIAQHYNCEPSYIEDIKAGRVHADIPGYYEQTGPVVMRSRAQIQGLH